ncbi:hypothetical protein ACQ4LE_010204 [Meloidogyne hapla]|uniref:Uncharacterized protein n=1 Tax=Meloidogyne hapla TaxID=6305 RepID=A0A1I8B4I7_MELHA
MTFNSIKIIILFSSILFKLTNQCINLSHSTNCDLSDKNKCCQNLFCKHMPFGCGYKCSNVGCIGNGKPCDISEDGCCYNYKCDGATKKCKKCSLITCKETDDCCNGHCVFGKCITYTDCRK